MGTEAVLTSTHNLCFRAKIRGKKYTPVKPQFYIQKWGVRGCKLHGPVIMMLIEMVLLSTHNLYLRAKVKKLPLFAKRVSFR